MEILLVILAFPAANVLCASLVGPRWLIGQAVVLDGIMLVCAAVPMQCGAGHMSMDISGLLILLIGLTALMILFPLVIRQKRLQSRFKKLLWQYVGLMVGCVLVCIVLGQLGRW